MSSGPVLPKSPVLAAPALVVAPGGPVLPQVTIAPRATSTGAAPTFSSLFKPASDIALPPRLAISLDALDKCGKSHWAIHTMPDLGAGIAIAMTDEGTLHVINKARAAGRKIAGVLDLLYVSPETVGKSQANAALQSE